MKRSRLSIHSAVGPTEPRGIPDPVRGRAKPTAPRTMLQAPFRSADLRGLRSLAQPLSTWRRVTIAPLLFAQPWCSLALTHCATTAGALLHADFLGDAVNSTMTTSTRAPARQTAPPTRAYQCFTGVLATSSLPCHRWSVRCGNQCVNSPRSDDRCDGRHRCRRFARGRVHDLRTR